MANIFEKDDEKKSGGVTGSQAPTLTQQQAVTTQGAGPQKGPASSGRFTGVQKFIKANRPGQFAQQAAGKVTGRAEQVQGQVGQAQQQFNVALDPTRQNVASGQQGIQGFTASETAGPSTGFSSAIQGISGPQVTGLTGADRLQSQARTVTGLGQALASGKGRQTALQQLYGRPSYSSGQQKFDALLLGSDPKALMQAKAKTAALQGMVGKSAQVAEQEAAGLAQAAEDTTGQARAEYEKRVQAYMDKVTKRAQEETGKRSAEATDLETALQSGQLSDEQFAKLGIDPAVGNYLSGDELKNLFSRGNIDISTNEALNTDEQAYLKSLQSAAGDKYQSAGTQTIGKSLGAEDLGQMYNKDKWAYKFDTDAMKFLNQQKQAEYGSGEQSVQAAQKQFQDIQKQFGFDNPEKLQNAANLAQMAERGEDLSSFKEFAGYRPIPGQGRFEPIYKSGQEIVNEYNTMQNAQKQAEAAKQGFDSRWGSVRRSLRR